MRRAGWSFWNFFEKRPQPAEAENASVGAIVRLLKSRHGNADEQKDEEEKDEELPPRRNDDFRNPRRR